MAELVRLGDRTGSWRLIPITSVHIPDWYRHRRSAAWTWLEAIAGKAYMPITANPGGFDDDASLCRKQLLAALRPNHVYTCSCTPYLSGNHPVGNTVAAWGGRAAVAFANSILGVRSEMEGFESALASAVTGLTPERGLHLDVDRELTVAVKVPAEIGSDYGMLGELVSRLVDGRKPLICGPTPSYDEAKRFAFSINGDGRVPLFKMGRALPAGTEVVEIEASEWHDALGDEVAPELLIMGCPHLSEQDINKWGRFMSGRRQGKADAWFFTSRLCLDKCPLTGAVLATRGKIMVDKCPLSMLDEIDGRLVGCDTPALASCLSAAGVKARPISYAEKRRLLAED